eukprot:CAMPEP_0185155234 /NCGR_PEP_ID=MMETSP1139-20130426/301_1 /TAXON_ID=298111 /ORGANISM="Pavlova sp., Strain CCMP459" /LENGTH=74 /DNA_ID=CAMNT_0027720123 /DNA_START=111 /DNA_END=335 /DNA_ORIENTATION=+
MAAVATVLNGDGAHYIAEEFGHYDATNPNDEHPDPKKAAAACMYAMVIYLAFLVGCGMKVYKLQSSGAKPDDSD